MENIEDVAHQAEQKFGLTDFAALVHACRSYRRFDESKPIPESLLVALTDIARVTSSGGNRLPLRFCIVSEPAQCAQIFDQLTWAALLKDWKGPKEGERPTGYIVICDAGGGTTTSVDEGIAATTIMLAATQAGFGGCMLHAFNRAHLTEILKLDDARVHPLMVLALGKPAETVHIESVLDGPDGSTTYWRDAQGGHHVPKRALGDIVL